MEDITERGEGWIASSSAAFFCFFGKDCAEKSLFACECGHDGRTSCEDVPEEERQPTEGKQSASIEEALCCSERIGAVVERSGGATDSSCVSREEGDESDRIGVVEEEISAWNARRTFGGLLL